MEGGRCGGEVDWLDRNSVWVVGQEETEIVVEACQMDVGWLIVVLQESIGGSWGDVIEDVSFVDSRGW